MQISTFLDSLIPSELGSHALKLWQELHECFAELSATSNVVSADQLHARKLRLLEALLGMETGSDASHGVVWYNSCIIVHSDKLTLCTFWIARWQQQSG